MHKWILHCFAHKKTTFAIAVVLLIISALGLRHLTFDHKMSLFKEDQFSQQVVIITVYDKHLFDVQHLQQLAMMQKELSDIKEVQSTTSLYTVPNLRRYIDEHSWHPVLENIPYFKKDLPNIKTDILDNKLFIGKFVNKKADTMLFYLYIPNDELGVKDLMTRDKIQKVLVKHQQHFSKIFQTGTPEMIYSFNLKSLHDLYYCIPGIFILMAILFGWFFRNIFLFSLPFFTSVFGAFCALGFMGWLSIPASPLFIIAIVINLAIGVAESAHIIHAYQKSLLLYPTASRQDRYAFLLKKILVPFLLAAFTAMLGFLLDILSFIPAIENLVYALALCIVFNTIAAIFIAPLFLPMLKLKTLPHRSVFNFLSKTFLNFHRWLIPHAKLAIIVFLSFGVASFFIFKNIAIEALPYSTFKKNDLFIKNIDFTEKKIAGTNILQVKIYAKDKNIFLTPKYLQTILDSEKNILKISKTSYVYSICDVLATANQIFLFNEKLFFKIPHSPDLLKAFYSQLATQNFTKALINENYNSLTLFVNYDIHSSQLLEVYKKNVENSLKEALKDTPLHFKIVDYWSEYSKIISNFLILQMASIFTIYLICFFIVGILFRSVTAGILSIFPNIFPLCIISFVQYAAHIPFSLYSLILYSIVIGLSIDETVHIFYAFKEQYYLQKNKDKAIEAALKAQIVPVTISSVSSSIACMILLFSAFVPLQQIGFLAGVGALSAWFADLVITPFLLQRFDITKRLKIPCTHQD